MLFNEKNGIKVAVYLRLSRDDGDKPESESISNQRTLLMSYIKEHPALHFVAEYPDDGYSGTTFERPAFQRMIEDAKRKRIDCILVKDLSRLGRNYIEVGRYLEKIFPLMGVRFIAVIDHYDSADRNNDSNDILVPFKNLINDAYCRDISMKIRSQLDMKRKNGQFIGSFAVYGYQKDACDKNHLVIDETTATVVRHIFELKLSGYSAQHIAAQLEKMAVLTPMEYKRSRGLNFNSGFRAKEKAHWDAMLVTRILTNETYTGRMVQGKNKKINYKVKKSKPVEQEKWIRMDAMHDAIIPQGVFEQVQELLLRDTRTAPGETSVYLLSGFVRCGDCGQNMVRRNSTKQGVTYHYFHCSTYKNGTGCSSHLINEEKLSAAILDGIQRQIALLVNVDKILNEMEQLPQEQCIVKTLDAQMEERNAEIERYQELKVQLYRDRQEGVVSVEEYGEINRRFSARIAEAKDTLKKITEHREKILRKDTNLWPWMESFRQYQNIEKLDRRVLVALVDHVTVYSKEKIEIIFRFQEEMQQMLACTQDWEETTEMRCKAQ